MHKDLDKIKNKGKNIDCKDSFSVFYGHDNIDLGSDIFLVDTLLNAGDNEGKITIEDYVFFGHGVKVLARGHDYKLLNKKRQESVVEKPIYIKQGAWIGSASTILSGVTIGKNSVVGAGSIVTKNIPDGAIVAGNPAKIIKYIDRKLTILEEIKKLLSMFKFLKNN